MNINFKRISIENVLFFDIEAVRFTENLDPNSKEFQLYQKKIRNRDTDELPTEAETIADYEKRAALKMGYTKIVTIGVAFVRAGEVYVKALTGEEKQVLKQLFEIMGQFDFICGVNILGYDLPQCYINAAKYFDYTDIVPDKFVTSGKKPWELKYVIDLMDVARGTHYANMSLDEMLYHFGLESSKTDIDGSQVSRVYYEGGIDRIVEYVKKDVFANVNLFRALQFERPYADFIDRSGTVTETREEKTALQRLYQKDYLADDIKKELQVKLKKAKPTKKDMAFIQDILENVYNRTTFMAEDSKEVRESKLAEIQEFLKTI
jgi:predicted PolB exonuclease-like 3'-5' exonuclease